MSRDIPIIFSAPMVLALLDGRKTMTRRLRLQKRKSAPHVEAYDHYFIDSPWVNVKPGDRLWARENFATAGGNRVLYAATDDVHELRKIKPSIYMPGAIHA